MSKTPSRQAIRRRARRTIARMTEFATKRYGFDSFSPFDVYIEFTPEAKSQGGRGLREGVQHAVLKLELYDFENHPVTGYTEYSNLNKIEGLGGFETDDWKLSLDALIAHEISHCVQHLIPHWNNSHKTDHPWSAGHGIYFQEIYREFREKFINPRIQPGSFKQPECSFDLTGTLIRDALVGREISLFDTSYRIEGRRPKAKKYHYLIRNIETREVFKLSRYEVMERLERQ